MKTRTTTFEQFVTALTEWVDETYLRANQCEIANLSSSGCAVEQVGAYLAEKQKRGDLIL